MILLKKLLLVFIGICGGGIVAGGVYAFLAIIGVFVRIIGKTGTGRQCQLFETVIILGGILGNVWDIYEFPIHMGTPVGSLFLCVAGLAMGIFVGCLAMSLAETLKALPTISRRIHLAVGLQYLIFAVAAGKMAGSFLFFWRNMAAMG